MSAPLLNSTTHKHPFSLASFADDALHYATQKIVSTGYSPVAKIAQAAVVSVLKHITEGRLRIVASTEVFEFPPSVDDDVSDLRGEIRVISDAFWVRLCTMGDLGFAEAYMYGDVECDDLISTFMIFIRNKDRISGLDSKMSWLFNLPQRLASYRFLNSLSNSPSNISAHYDLSDGMFKAFLSEDMSYSCAIFSDLDGDLKQRPELGFTASQIRKLTDASFVLSPLISPATSTPAMSPSTSATTLPTPPLADTLHAAQLRKLAHITGKASIRPGHRVLEIGCGWGALALHIATTFPGTQVDALTLSVHQHAHVARLVAAAGVQDRVRVHLLDYREMPAAWTGTFDRVVSVEMVEHLGAENVVAYWAAIDRVLKQRCGAGVVSSTTIPEARFEQYARQVDFIQKWSASPIFPGGLLPTPTLLLTSMAGASAGRLVVDSVSNIGPHYARTLREWRRAFEVNFADVEQALRMDHPGVFDGLSGQRELAVFRRKWIYYFRYCEVGFTTRLLGNHIITFTREGNEEFGFDIYE
ncbi:cyclopropane-fatty-acyl-phospholipid synthase [Artomyces pyxidatus]|uniref:Cyclopropane-fatty-acyl-phospholipid synthase n=1 Tax=Artomyces pyxidatus TaxID=48021 RepID=A0ACB8T3I5_9AGAM|nr:cyclopropane-fatty-acyl-phospholipid synthase [Artomyces pyxidatus]